MSLSNQQITSGKAGTSVYSSGDTVLANAAQRLHLSSFRSSDVAMIGLSIGLGVSDKTAWGNGLFFEVFIGGRRVYVIDDEICTLLNKEFLPMDIPHNSAIDLYCTNGSAADILVAAFIRAEVL